MFVGYSWYIDICFSSFPPWLQLAKVGTMDSRYNEPPFSELLGIMNEFLYPSDKKTKQKQNKNKKNLDITKPRYSQYILPVL